MNQGMPSWAELMARMPKSSVFPQPSEVAHGLETIKYKKTPVVVSEYHVEVFDMESKKDREDYCKLMLDLANKVQNSQCMIGRQELEKMTSKDGSTTWKRYVEWFDYKLNDTSTTTKTEDEEKDGDESENG
jgi:hypothetical protein